MIILTGLIALFAAWSVYLFLTTPFNYRDEEETNGDACKAWEKHFIQWEKKKVKN